MLQCIHPHLITFKSLEVKHQMLLSFSQLFVINLRGIQVQVTCSLMQHLSVSRCYPTFQDPYRLNSQPLYLVTDYNTNRTVFVGFDKPIEVSQRRHPELRLSVRKN